MKYRHIGVSASRFDAVEKVTGEAKFTADIQDPACLTAKILRSPYAHALIKDIRKENALSVPGVKAIVTGMLVRLPSQVGVPLIVTLAKSFVLLL